MFNQRRKSCLQTKQRIGGGVMKIYKITKVSSLHDIEVQAKDDKEIMKLYHEGTVDEILSTKNDHVGYQIKDEDGNLIYGHIYT